MTSNLRLGSISENRDTVQPISNPSIRDKADSVPAALNNEDALVSGALQSSEDSTSFHTAPQEPSGSISQGSAFRRTSLEVLEQSHSFVHITLPEINDALSTALPVSNDEESLSGSTNSNANVNVGAPLQEPVVPTVNPYASTIETLSSHLPHLINVKRPSRHRNVSVTCYDYIDDALASVEAFSVIHPSDELQTAEGMSLRRYLEDVPSKDVQLRLIVADDLSSDVIECLGTSLSMSPEVYEEHLVNSGWQNGIYNDQEADTWITRDMQKSHISIKWYRPVKRVLQRPYSRTDRQGFLDPRVQSWPWTETVPEGSGKPYGVQHFSSPATNIFRQDWDIKTDAEAAISTGGFTAWEERATVWNKQSGGYRVGQTHTSKIYTDKSLTYFDIAVLLLDPLPIMIDEMSGATEALRKLGVDHTKPTAKRQLMNKGPVSKGITELLTTDQPSKALVKSTTFVRHRPKADQNFSFTLLGRWMLGTSLRPLDSSRDDERLNVEREVVQSAEDPESGEQGRERQQKITGIARPGARSGLPKLLDRLFRRSRKKTEKVEGADEVDVREEIEGTEMKTLRPMNRCMFEGLYPRGPAVDYDFLLASENVGMLAEYLSLTKTTAANLAEWLTHNGGRQPLMSGPTTHLGYLFAIIQKDMINTLRHMDSALQEIGQHILDDTLIQQRLVHWRLLLERFGNELQKMEDSLRRFAEFIKASEDSYKSKEASPDRHISPVQKLLEESISQINSVRQRTTRSHKSLMANMSIVESKRGIAEAESVTKLTELAFFFIPLTFSASIFSMQVKELDASRVSIAAFFILAIIITTASYALRLLIRSENFIDFRRKLLKDIRQDAGLAPVSPIPTQTFLAWLWRRIGLLVVIVTVLVVLLITPVAVLWTRDMNHGFKVLLTILLLAFILAASYVTGNAMLYIDARGLHLRRDIFKSAKFKERPYHSLDETLAFLFSWLSIRWLLIGLGVTGVGAGPAAALWTSQLTTAIKVGITIAITILYVSAIVSILIYRLYG